MAPLPLERTQDGWFLPSAEPTVEPTVQPAE